ncbi:MAG: hypothetical protein WEB88_02845 [Gemmatimonadota bacterium]
MATVREVYDSVRNDTDAVMKRWRHSVATEPGLMGARELDVDALPELISTALDVLEERPDQETSRRNLLKWTLEHGHYRIRESVPDDMLFKEYHVLRYALWDTIRERHGTNRLTSTVITQLDAVLSVASRASLRGYYHEHFETGGEDMAENLLEDGPWPLHTEGEQQV